MSIGGVLEYKAESRQCKRYAHFEGGLDLFEGWCPIREADGHGDCARLAFQSRASQQVSLHHAVRSNGVTVANLTSWREAWTITVLHRFLYGVVK